MNPRQGKELFSMWLTSTEKNVFVKVNSLVRSDGILSPELKKQFEDIIFEISKRGDMGIK